jgi:hypothetical protein
MGALARKLEFSDKRPFAVKQHVPANDHQGIGDPKDSWNWTPSVPKHEIMFSETTASMRTRTNTRGIADEGEYYHRTRLAIERPKPARV